jgi:hypothetical protein
MQERVPQTSAPFARESDQQQQQRHPNAENRYPNQSSVANNEAEVALLGILLDPETV